MDGVLDGFEHCPYQIINFSHIPLIAENAYQHNFFSFDQIFLSFTYTCKIGLKNDGHETMRWSSVYSVEVNVH